MKEKQIRIWVCGTIGVILLVTFSYWVYVVGRRSAYESEIAKMDAAQKDAQKWRDLAIMASKNQPPPQLTNDTGY